MESKMTLTEAIVQAGDKGIIRRREWTHPGHYGEPVWVVHNAQIKEYKFDRLGTPIMYTFDVSAIDWEIMEKPSTENAAETLEKISSMVQEENTLDAIGLLQQIRRTLESEYKYKKIINSLY